MDDQQIKELMDKIDQLIKALKDQGKFNYVNIEHADIQGPLVDKLDYHFDKLDVKEVSGALNLGTTFGVKVAEKKRKSDSGGSGPKKSKQESDESESKKKNQSQSQSTGGTQPKPQPQSQSTSGTHSQSQPPEHNTDSSSRKPSRENLVTEDSKEVEQQPKRKTTPNRAQKQLPYEQKKNEPSKVKRPKKEIPSPEQNYNDTGRVKLTFSRRNQIDEKKNQGGATPTAEAPDQSVKQHAENKTNVTYNAKRNTPEAKANESQSQKEVIQTKEPETKNQIEETKTVNPLSSTKKGFTIKLG